MKKENEKCLLVLFIIISFSIIADTVLSCKADLEINYGHIRISRESPPGTPTVVVNPSAGNLNGDYYYRISFVTAGGETTISEHSTKVSPANERVDISAISIGTDEVTARKIYRTTANPDDVYARMKYVVTLNDNTTTTYTDNISDGNLGDWNPGINTTGGLIYVNNIPSMVLGDLYSLTAVGYRAGESNKGYYNTAFGTLALYSNTTGSFNAASGYNSMRSNTVGEKNTAYGHDSMYHNTTGIENTAVGSWALSKNEDGNYNVAIGNNALYNNISGSYNMALGKGALTKNTTSYNTAMGVFAAYYNTGVANIAVGHNALFYQETGGWNVGIGQESGKGTATHNSSFNVFIGAHSGYSNSTGGKNIFIGRSAGYHQTTNSNLLIIDNQNRGSVAAEATDSLIYGEFNATQASQKLIINADLVSNTYNFAADAQDNDAYVILLDPPPKAYITGMMIVFTANTENTGSCAVNVNMLGAIPLKMLHDQDPEDNYIESGSVVVAVYDGNNFQMIQPTAN